MIDPTNRRPSWEADLARAGIALPEGDAAAAWDEARRLAAVARRIRERIEGGQ